MADRREIVLPATAKLEKGGGDEWIAEIKGYDIIGTGFSPEKAIDDADNPLERLFDVRGRLDEVRKDLKNRYEEFENRPEIVALTEEEGRLQSEESGLETAVKDQQITRQGRYYTVFKRRTTRTVIPVKFAERFGLQKFCEVATIPVGKAEKAVGKDQLADCCDIETVTTGVEVHVELGGGDAE